MAVLQEYMWLVVVGSMAAWAFGWATGSNDVANAFGTSVGARTLTLKQAVIIAAVFEFTGALVLGRVSTSVIAGSIAKISYFQSVPELYAYGMVCALTTGFVWQGLASYCEMNVSATHSIIGGIIGFSLVYGGGSAVNWATKDPSGKSFPPYTGVVPIILSWFVSPVLTAAASALLFLLLRTLVLRRPDSRHKSLWVLPLAVFLTTWVNVYFILTKGVAKTLAKNGESMSTNTAAWIAAVCAAGCFLATVLIALPLLRHRTNLRFDEDGQRIPNTQRSGGKGLGDANDGGAEGKGKQVSGPPTPSSEVTPDPEAQAQGAPGQEPSLGGGQGAAPMRTNTGGQESSSSEENSFRGLVRKVTTGATWAYHRAYAAATYGTNYDIHKVVEEDPIVAKIHAKAETFDPRAEYAFAYLQVFSAICVMLAHGAGEVGYMAGPLTTIWEVVQTGTLPSKVVAPVWIIIISASGLVVGLATYGYKVTQAMGARLAKLSPTRGFCAELSTAMVIMVASQYGLPTSSSQCITGGIIGVGLAEGIGGVNWKFFARTFASWVSTLAVVGLATAALFAQAVFAPSIPASREQSRYETATITMGRSFYAAVNGTLNQYRGAIGTNPNLQRPTPAEFAALDQEMRKQDAQGATWLTPAKTGTVKSRDAINYLAKAVALVQQETVITLGQQNVHRGAPACNNASYNPAVPATTTVACPAPNLLGRVGAPYNTTTFP